MKNKLFAKKADEEGSDDVRLGRGLKNVKRRKRRKGLFAPPSKRVESVGEGHGSEAERPAEKPRAKKKRPNRWTVFSQKFGYTRLFVKGKSGAAALSAVQKFAPVSDVAFSNEGTYFTVPSKLCGKILAILSNLCYDYKIIKYYGASALVRTTARVGILLGVLLVVAAIVLYPALITRVSVEGELDGVLNDKIFGILREYGVTEGNMIFSLDADGIEKRILALEGVAYAGVIRNGTRISVVVKREQPRENFVGVGGSRVVSEELATVTRVVVNGGTAAVKYGDVVEKGDLLIDGYVMYGDSRIDVEAKGVVYGVVYKRKTVFFADEPVTRVRGEVKKMTKLSFFGSVPKPPASPYEKYELKVSVSDIGFLLPIKAYTYEFCEITEQSGVNTLSEEEMKAAVYSQMISEISSPFKVVERSFDLTMMNGGAYVTVTVGIEKVISKYSDA